MVQLYRDLARLCHSRRKELWIGLQLGRYAQFAVDPALQHERGGAVYQPLENLVGERVADAFILGDYELVSIPAHVCWTTKKDIRLGSGEDLYTWAAREYKAYCQGRPVSIFFSNGHQTGCRNSKPAHVSWRTSPSRTVLPGLTCMKPGTLN